MHNIEEFCRLYQVQESKDKKFYFKYTAFLAGKYAQSLSNYINSLMSLSMIDQEVQRVVSVFQMSINNGKAIAINVKGISESFTSISFDENPENIILAMKDCIVRMLPVADVFLPLINILISQEFDVDGTTDLLSIMDDFHKTYDQLTQLEKN